MKEVKKELENKKKNMEEISEQLEEKYMEKYDKLDGNSNGKYDELTNDVNSKKGKLTAEEEKITKGGESDENEKSIKAYADKEKEVDTKKQVIENYKNDSIKTYASDITSSEHKINYGVKLGVKYTGVENLTLTANGIFGASTFKGIENITKGHVKLELGAKYDYKVNDKFAVSPEFNVTSKFSEIQKDKFKSELILAPKVSAKYAPIKKLNISGEVEVPVKLSGDKSKFGFNTATIKTGLNIKYTW